MSCMKPGVKTKTPKKKRSRRDGHWPSASSFLHLSEHFVVLVCLVFQWTYCKDSITCFDFLICLVIQGTYLIRLYIIYIYTIYRYVISLSREMPMPAKHCHIASLCPVTSSFTIATTWARNTIYASLAQVDSRERGCQNVHRLKRISA